MHARVECMCVRERERALYTRHLTSLSGNLTLNMLRISKKHSSPFYTQAQTPLVPYTPNSLLCICSLISMHTVTPTAHYRQTWCRVDGRRNVEGVTLPQDPLSKVLLKRGNELICIFLLKHAEWWRKASCYIMPSSWVCPQACSQALHSTENTCVAPIKIHASDKSFQRLSKDID